MAELPEGFDELEPFVAWSLETEPERCAKRQASSMRELQALYDAVLPRAEEIFAYLDKFPLDAMPVAARRLFLLTLALAEVAPAVELFGQVSVVDGYDINRFRAERRE